MTENIQLIVICLLLGAWIGATLVVLYHRKTEQEIRDEVRAEAFIDKEKSPLNSPQIIAMLAAMPGMTIVVNKDNKILHADTSARALGLIRGTDSIIEQIVPIVEKARQRGDTDPVELSLPRPNVPGRHTIDLRVAASPLPHDNILITIQDISERKRLDDIRRDFTANASHELKTPVGAIQLLAETISDSATDTTAVRHFSNLLQNEAERLSQLIHDIINLSTLQETNPMKDATNVSLSEVIAESCERMRTVANARGITFDIENRDIIDEATLWGNKELIITAVFNILDNAVRYSPDNSTVTITADQSNQYTTIHIIDRGVGIPLTEQKRIFERFYRVDSGRSREDGGTGLGLSIVKHIMNEHGGYVSVISEGVQSNAPVLNGASVTSVKEAPRSQSHAPALSGSTFCLHFPRKDDE